MGGDGKVTVSLPGFLGSTGSRMEVMSLARFPNVLPRGRRLGAVRGKSSHSLIGSPYEHQIFDVPWFAEMKMSESRPSRLGERRSNCGRSDSLAIAVGRTTGNREQPEWLGNRGQANGAATASSPTVQQPRTDRRLDRHAGEQPGRYKSAHAEGVTCRITNG